MMKLPDITLLFQMVNFLLAYLILRRFIFVPVYAIIQQQKQKDNVLHDKVSVTRDELKNSLDKQHQRWNFIRYSLMQMIPSIKLKKCLSRFKKTSSPEVSKIKISQAEKDSIKKMLHDTLLDIS